VRLLEVLFVWLLDVLLVSEPLPVSVVPTLVSELPRSASLFVRAHPTNRAAAANKQIIFIMFVLIPFLSVVANIFAQRRIASMGQIRTKCLKRP
jgi:hypothetical protein